MPQGIVEMGVDANKFDRHKGTKEQMCTFILNLTDHNISSTVKVLQINIYHCGIAFKSSYIIGITIAYLFGWCYSQYQLSILNFPCDVFQKSFSEISFYLYC